MNVKYRRTLAALGATAAAVASTAFLAAPAQAATTGLAQVIGTNRVSFQALMGRVNSVSVTISGRTVTIDDRVAITAGRGCKRVDSTKVRCTAAKAVARIDAALGDKNDWVRNYTGVFMLAGGGAGNDTLIGGPGRDQLQGGGGNDRMYGGNGTGELFGEGGADYIVGGAGYDYVAAGAGNDTVYSGPASDQVHGQAGVDVISAGAGNDTVMGYAGNDRVWGGVGRDFLIGGVGNDSLAGEAGDDVLVAENYVKSGGKGISSGSASAVDRLSAGANTSIGDICLRSSSKTITSGCEWYTSVASAAVSSAPTKLVAPMKIG